MAGNDIEKATGCCRGRVSHVQLFDFRHFRHFLPSGGGLERLAASAALLGGAGKVKMVAPSTGLKFR